jgi:hypothetical protein
VVVEREKELVFGGDGVDEWKASSSVMKGARRVTNVRERERERESVGVPVVDGWFR